MEEDSRRREILSQEFDPVTGSGSVGKRFLLYLPDYSIPRQYLPITMREVMLIKSLENFGSIKQYCEAYHRQRTDVERELRYLRALHDFPYWAASYCIIKCKGGGDDIPFRLNRPQRRLVEAFEKQRISGKPIRIILLKARQWGGSTCSQLYMAWLQLLHSRGLNSLIIAHQGMGSDEIKDMFDRMMARYPSELLEIESEDASTPSDPTVAEAMKSGKKITNVGKSGSIFRVPARNCKIKIGTAERPDSCRGGDYNLVHLSEVGIWRTTAGKSPEAIVRSACGGILLRPMTMIVYESTANGTGNFFHREYMAATRGESQFSPLFISWWEIDQYSLQLTEDKRRHLAEQLVAGRESESSTDRTESGKYLWHLFEIGASLEAIAWYISERAKYNDHADMAAEYPTDDVEAFAHSGCRIFDRYQVERMRPDCCSPAFRGEIESRLGDGDVARDNLSFHQMERGGLEVWKLPDASESLSNRYLTVVDVGGRSAKSDWSVVTVFDRAPMREGLPIEVVAQWRGHCDLDRLAWKAARIAAFYHNALLVIESNSIETHESYRMIDDGQMPYILLQIKDLYPNIYERAVSADNIRDGISFKLGFHTNSATKPMIIATLIRALREHLWIERSEDALDELLSYERTESGGYSAILGAHDDMLMTRAIGLHISLHEMPFPSVMRRRGYDNLPAGHLYDGDRYITGDRGRRYRNRPDCAF